MKPNKILDLVNIDRRTLFLNIYSKIDKNNEDFINIYDWFVNSMYLELGNPNLEFWLLSHFKKVSIYFSKDKN